MRRWTRFAVLMLALGSVAVLPFRAAAQWPQTCQTDQAAFVVYQPQVDAFEGNKLKVRIAFQATPPGGTGVYGTVSAVGRIATNRQTREVRILDLRILQIDFGDKTAAAGEKLDAVLRAAVPTWVLKLSMDRFLASLSAADHEAILSQQVVTQPPNIFTATRPTVLVFINGDPKTEPLDKGPILRIVNTPFFLVFDPRSLDYYLKAGNGYLTAKKLAGPWQTANTPPSSVVAGATAAGYPPVPLEGQPSAAVRVTTEPTALIQSAGEPKYAPAPGSGDLLYVKNSPDDVFLEIRRHRYYVLISGRWFTSLSLSEGNWKPVPPGQLPPSFGLIPEESAKAYVLPQVPSSRPAREALLETLIPQTMTVKLQGPQPSVHYDGEPQFVPIPGTGCEYAPNCNVPVFRIAAAYYCCHEAVWYTAEKPTGTWQVCTRVPSAIQTLPASFPLHYVKYVHVYDVVGNVAYVGYTPGYLGTEVENGCVVYGSPVASSMRNMRVPYPSCWAGSVAYNPWLGEWGFRLATASPASWVSVHCIPGSDAYTGGGWWGPDAFREAALNIVTDAIGNQVRVPAAVGTLDIYQRAGNRKRNANNLRGTPLDQFPMWTLRGQTPPAAVTQASRPGAPIVLPTFKAAGDQATDNVFAGFQGRVYINVEGEWRVRADGFWQKAFVNETGEGNVEKRLDRELRVRNRGRERTRAFRDAVDKANKTNTGGLPGAGNPVPGSWSWR